MRGEQRKSRRLYDPMKRKSQVVPKSRTILLHSFFRPKWSESHRILLLSQR
eukprot:UN15454